MLSLDEVCEQLGKNRNTILKNYKRTRENLKKKGILLTRYGSGEKAVYTIEYIKPEE